MLLRRTFAVAILAIAAAASVGFAHVFWIDAANWRPSADEAIRLYFRLGDGFPGETIPRRDDRIVEFHLITPDGTRRPIVGADGAAAAGLVRPAGPGTHLAVYRSNHATSNLEPQKFEAYLREEGLEHIIEQRQSTGRSAEPGRERYARCAKALFAVDGKGGPGFDRPAGLRFEIIPQKDPSSLKPGDAMPFLVLFDGKPAKGILLRAAAPKQTGSPLSARTSEAGTASLVLAEPGLWRVEAVTMFEAPKNSGADWESLWASLTFSTGA